jgi:hypothetical protein
MSNHARYYIQTIRNEPYEWGARRDSSLTSHAERSPHRSQAEGARARRPAPINVSDVPRAPSRTR